MATLYARAAGGAWATVGTWSDTDSSGASSGTVPSSTVDVIFDAGSTGLVTLGAGTLACKTLTFEGAGNQIEVTSLKNLNVYSHLTLYSGMSITGTGLIIVRGTTTITSNGVVVPCNMSFFNSSHITLSGDLTLSGSFTAGISEILGDKLILGGGFTGAPTITGTSGVYLTGGTWDTSSGPTGVQNLFLDGDVLVGVNPYYGGGTLKYLSGTIDTTTNISMLHISSSCTLDTEGMSWYDIAFEADAVLSLKSKLSHLNTIINNGYTVGIEGLGGGMSRSRVVNGGGF